MKYNWWLKWYPKLSKKYLSSSYFSIIVALKTQAIVLVLRSFSSLLSPIHNSFCLFSVWSTCAWIVSIFFKMKKKLKVCIIGFSGYRDGFLLMIIRLYKRCIGMTLMIAWGHSFWKFRIISLQKSIGVMLCLNSPHRDQSIQVLPLILQVTSHSLLHRLVFLLLRSHGMWHGEQAWWNHEQSHQKHNSFVFLYKKRNRFSSGALVGDCVICFLFNPFSLCF